MKSRKKYQILFLSWVKWLCFKKIMQLSPMRNISCWYFASPLWYNISTLLIDLWLELFILNLPQEFLIHQQSFILHLMPSSHISQTYKQNFLTRLRLPQSSIFHSAVWYRHRRNWSHIMSHLLFMKFLSLVSWAYTKLWRHGEKWFR